MPRTTEETTEEIRRSLILDFGYTPQEALNESALLFGDLIANGTIDHNDIATSIQYSGLSDLFNEFNIDDINELLMDNFIEDDDLIRIGGAYKGVKIIKEEDKDNVYIPSSNFCAFKCIEKYYKIAKNEDIEFPRDKKYVFCNTKEYIKKQVCRLFLKKDENESDYAFNKRKNEFFEKNIPPFVHVRINKNKSKNEVSFVRVSNGKTYSNDGYAIGLLHISKNLQHAVLLKNNEIGSYKKSDFTIKFENNTKLTSTWCKSCNNIKKEKAKYIIAYDIETSTIKKDIKIGDKLFTKNELIPYALKYSLIDISKINHKTDINNNELLNEIMEEFEINEIITNDYLPENESDIYNRLIKDIYDKYSDLIINEIQIFAHNGSKFDNLFTKRFIDDEEIKAMNTTGSFNQVKRIDFEYKKKLFIFKDTYLFMPISLKELCDKFNNKYKKMDFDIVGWTREEYKNNMLTGNNCKDKSKDWRLYLEYDVLALKEVMIKAEIYFNKYYYSLSNKIGLPGIANSLISDTCYGFSKLYIPTHQSMIKLIRSSIYGGRVLCLKRYFKSQNDNDKLICIDANSLYPSAIALGTFPIGKPNVLCNKNEIIDENKIIYTELLLSELQNSKNNDYRCKSVRHYILTIRFRIPNIKITICPYRNEKGNLIYPSNGIYEGTYNDVDIREMLIEGYEILEIINGIYWISSNRIFTHVINSLYNDRKICTESNDETGSYILKILLNSVFGQLTMFNDEKNFFCNDNYKLKENERDIIYESGIREVVTKLEVPSVDKPIQIGSYILSYSRSIMNEYIRKIGINNVYYSDTDSLYTLNEAFLKSGITINNDLGGVKNDYGDGIFIDEAIFLDIKKYFLHLSNGKFKAKLVGFIFKNLDLNMESNDVSILNELNNEDKKKLSKDELKAKLKIISDINEKKTREIYYDLMNNYDEFKESNKNIINQLDPENTKTNDIYNKIKKNNKENNILTDKKLFINKIKETPLIIEKWGRKKGEIFIDVKEIKYTISPHSRGVWVKDESCIYSFNSFKFDNKIEEFKKIYDHDNVMNYTKKFKVINCDIFMDGDILVIKSSIPLTHNKTLAYKNNDNLKIDSSIKKIDNTLVRTQKKYIFNEKTQKVEHDSTEYYKTGKYGILNGEKIIPSLNENEIEKKCIQIFTVKNDGSLINNPIDSLDIDRFNRYLTEKF